MSPGVFAPIIEIVLVERSIGARIMTSKHPPSPSCSWFVAGEPFGDGDERACGRQARFGSGERAIPTEKRGSKDRCGVAIRLPDEVLSSIMTLTIPMRVVERRYGGV